MFFQITHYEDDGEGVVPGVSFYQWKYRQGTPENPGEALFAGPATYTSETAARSDIAKVRKGCSGIKFAKVVGCDA